MVTLSIGSDAASASNVRRALHDELTEHGADPDAVDDLVLVASELVTNSLTHTHVVGDVCVEWSISDHEATIRVTDTGAANGMQPVMRAAESHEVSGRGLAIVDALSDRWGVESGPHSVTVWAVRRI